MTLKIKYSKGKNPLADVLSDSPSVEAEAEYKKLMIMEELLKLMREEGINRTQLAERMGVKPSRITAMMSGSNNFTIETLVRAGRALDAELVQHFVPKNHAAHFSICHEDEVNEAFSVKAKEVRVNPVEFKIGRPTATDDNADAA